MTEKINYKSLVLINTQRFYKMLLLGWKSPLFLK